MATQACAGGCGVQVDVGAADNGSDCGRPVAACTDCVLARLADVHAVFRPGA